MRMVIWNMGGNSKGLGESHERAWTYLAELEPDLALIQEVAVPDWVERSFSVQWESAYGERGMLKWGSAVVVRGTIVERFDLLTLEPNLDAAFEWLRGKVVGARVDLADGPTIIAISVHAPNATLEKALFAPDLLTSIKLKLQKDVWYADVVFGAARHLPETGVPFVIGGDWNLSRLFDERYGPRGNVEFLERMEAKGLVDCFYRQHGAEHRTWFRAGDAHFQLDHFFCDERSYDRLRGCYVDAAAAEERALSDHAPIVAEWD